MSSACSSGRVGALSTPLVGERTGEERPAIPIDSVVSESMVGQEAGEG